MANQTADLLTFGLASGDIDALLTFGLYETLVSQVATPTFSPVAGSYGGTQSVTISSGTSGATIRYTTDGSAPSESVGTIYSAPVSVSATGTLKAIAYKSGLMDSDIGSAAYTINSSTITGVTVSPSAVNVAGGFTQSFTAVVTGTGTPSQSVTWSAVYGSFSGSVYTAPVATDSLQTDTITATASDNTHTGHAVVTIPATGGGGAGATIVRFMNPTIAVFDGGCSAAGNSATNIKARVGDSFAISLTVVNSDDQDQSAGIEGYTVTGSTYNAGTAVSTAIACPVGEASRGSVSYPLQPDDVAGAARLSLYLDITNGVDRRRLGPVTIIVQSP